MTIDAFIDALPKVELHVHLIGSASVPTVLELSRRHPDSRVPTTEEGLRAFYGFRDFPHFAEVYQAVNALVRTPEDIATLVTGLAGDLARQNGRYVELTVTPYAHHIMGMPMREVTEAFDLAARHSRDEHGIQVAYIFDIPGEYGVEAARITLDHALREPPEALVGFGLAGIEQERPQHRDAFRDAFRAATAAGLRSLPHAGEMNGPETDLGGPRPPGRRADRPRHRLPGRPPPRRAPARDPDPPGGLSHLQRVHRAGRPHQGASAPTPAGGGSVRHPQQRRPAHVRHHAEHASIGSPPGSSAWTGRPSQGWPATPSTRPASTGPASRKSSPRSTASPNRPPSLFSGQDHETAGAVGEELERREPHEGVPRPTETTVRQATR